jgi:large subunit ribosomal protein L9
LAVEATPGNLKDIAHKNEAQEARFQKEKDEALALAQLLTETEVSLAVKCGDKDRLFGSVTTKEIADFLTQEHGITLDKRKFELKEPIRALGSYKVLVRLFPEISCEMTVHVVRA